MKSAEQHTITMQREREREREGKKQMNYWFRRRLTKSLSLPPSHLIRVFRPTATILRLRLFLFAITMIIFPSSYFAVREALEETQKSFIRMMMRIFVINMLLFVVLEERQRWNLLSLSTSFRGTKTFFFSLSVLLISRAEKCFLLEFFLELIMSHINRWH